jgi:carboxyl-terminal processing protease
MFLLSLMLVTVAFVGGFATSRALVKTATSQTSDGSPPEFRSSIGVFWEAWNIVQNEFYKQPLDPNNMTYGAISGMVDALGDPHTAFVNPTIANRINQDLQGSFEGIGATVEMRDGRLTIVAPIKGTPADKAGLKAGDVVLKVGDTVIQNMTVEEAIALIRGPKGSTITLTVQRGSQPAFEINIQRDTIQIPFVESKMLEGNIAYVKLNEFSATAPQELDNQLRAVLSKNPKALVFDLRNNPGGFLDAAIKIASEFIKQDNVVLVEGFKNGDKQTYKAQSGGVATDIPMVLLVNDGSASASEIVSGAIKDYKRATIIGVKTYGKGSVQVPHQLSDGSQLRVTIAHFFSPQEHEINGVGISPDIEVANPTDADTARGRDPQLDRAVQFINSGAQLQFGQWALPALPFFLPRMAALPL